MVEIAITKMSSKGQIVIPNDMRTGFKQGEKLVIIRNGKQLLLKKTNDFYENLVDDLEFARRTEEAYKKYEKGEFIETTFDDFLKKLKKR